MTEKLSDLHTERHRLTAEIAAAKADKDALNKALIPIWSREAAIEDEIRKTYAYNNRGIPIAMSGNKAVRRRLFAILDENVFAYGRQKGEWRDSNDLIKRLERESDGVDREIEKEVVRIERQKAKAKAKKPRQGGFFE